MRLQLSALNDTHTLRPASPPPRPHPLTHTSERISCVGWLARLSCTMASLKLSAPGSRPCVNQGCAWICCRERRWAGSATRMRAMRSCRPSLQGRAEAGRQAGRPGNAVRHVVMEVIGVVSGHFQLCLSLQSAARLPARPPERLFSGECIVCRQRAPQHQGEALHLIQGAVAGQPAAGGAAAAMRAHTHTSRSQGPAPGTR